MSPNGTLDDLKGVLKSRLASSRLESVIQTPESSLISPIRSCALSWEWAMVRLVLGGIDQDTYQE